MALAAMAVSPALSALAQTGAVRDAARERVQDIRSNVRGNVQERKENVKENVQERKENIKANVQERRENIKENAQERRTAVRENVAERRKAIIRNHFNRMMKRLEAALERGKKLGDRIQSRIEKAKANGKNTAKAQTALDKARAAWQEAKAALEEAKSKLEGVLSSTDPKAAFKEVHDLVVKARDKIKAVHAALVDAVTALKGLGEGRRSGSSVAPTTNPAPVSTPSTVE